MATQRLTVATLAGRAADAVVARFEEWRANRDGPAVDQFCLALRERALALPVVYFAEWVDRWLMGDLVPGPDQVDGQRFQVATMSPERARAWADQCGSQFAEQQWFASRLREAAAGWGTVTDRYAVVVIREVIGASSSDDEVRASLNSVPPWLSADRSAAS
jgi:hypothetical protein